MFARRMFHAPSPSADSRANVCHLLQAVESVVGAAIGGAVRHHIRLLRSPTPGCAAPNAPSRPACIMGIICAVRAVRFAPFWPSILVKPVPDSAALERCSEPAPLKLCTPLVARRDGPGCLCGPCGTYRGPHSTRLRRGGSGIASVFRFLLRGVCGGMCMRGDIRQPLHAYG
jgi:hypothetical protein